MPAVVTEALVIPHSRRVSDGARVADRWPGLGLRRSATYNAANAGTPPVDVLEVGGKLRVPTAPLRRLLGLDEEQPG